MQPGTPPCNKNKRGLTCASTQGSGIAMGKDYRWRAWKHGMSAIFASLFVLAGIASLAATADAATVGDHGDVPLAKQSATQARKKTKPAQPTIKMKLLGSVAPVSPGNGGERRGWLYTDGVRWAAYEPTVGVTRLIETVKNKAIERVDPEGCAEGLIAVGGGELLYSCEDPECLEHERVCPLPSNNRLTAARYVVEDIASGAQHPVAGENTLLDNGSEGGPSGLYEIGSQWAKGEVGSNAGAYKFFLNWHTGRFVRESEGSEDNIENLSSSNLTQPLCKPIKRPANEAEYYKSSAYSPLEYEPPFAVVGPLGTASEVSYVPLQLRKCGSRKSVLLPVGGGVQLGGRLLSWVGNDPYITQLHAKGRKWHGLYYKLVGLPSKNIAFGLLGLVQHTSSMVFATVQSGPTGAQIYLAHLPWVSPIR